MSFGLDDIGEFFESLPSIPGDLVDAATSLFDGPGGVVGIFVSGTTLLVGGPMAMIPALISGVALTEAVNLLIKTREMNAEERTLAELVFGNSLPPNHKIKLTNLSGLDGRAFTIPNAAGEYLVNLGGSCDDPIRSRHYPENGQLLIHELAHVWQMHHHKFKPGLICEGILNQSRYTLGEDVYTPETGQDWENYNLEQQATLIDLWYAGYMKKKNENRVFRIPGIEGCSMDHPFYQYVLQVNGGAPPPAVQALSIRTITRRKFGIESNLTVRSRFPLHKAGSLRRSLIGLRG